MPTETRRSERTRPAALAAIVAVSLLLPVAPFTGTADADHTPCHELRNHPLWIRNVEILEDEPSPDDGSHVTDDGAAYVEPGTELGFEVEIVNRDDDLACPVEARELADQLTLQLRYLDVEGGSEPLVHSVPFSGCGGQHDAGVAPGESCSQTIGLPASVDAEVQPAATPSNEQRIRFVVYDDDASYDPQTDAFSDCARDDSVTAIDPAVGACTGAERIVVSDALPDLTTADLAIPGEQPRTSYEMEQLGADVEIANQGGYANWNPNGARGDDEFWARSSFDGDGDGEPEEAGAGTSSWDEADVPACKDEAREWPLPDSSRCSYRRGQVLQIPVWYELTRTGDDALLERASVDFYGSTIDGPNHDKGFAVLAGDSDTRERELVSLHKRGGEYDLRLVADRDASEDEVFEVPESDEQNNELVETIDVLAVDLAITEPRVVAETADGTTGCTDPSDPCPTDGSVIRYDPRYENAGDPEVDGELTERTWRGSVYHDGEMVDWRNESQIPLAGEEGSLFDLPHEIEPDEGGAHTVEVRLDHQDNYAEAWDGVVTDDRGRVGERTERNGCPDGSSLDNTYCQTFYFEDQDGPGVADTRIFHTDESGEPVPVPPGGEVAATREVTFEATLEGSEPVQSVTAIFEHPDGSPAELQRSDGDPESPGPVGEPFSELAMEPAEDEPNTYRVTVPLWGNLTTYVYKVEAEGVSGSTTETFGAFDLTLRDPAVNELSIRQQAAVEPVGIGEHVVETVVGNEGIQRTNEIHVDVDACPAGPVAQVFALDGCETLLDVSADGVAHGHARTYTVVWQTVDQAGHWEVCSTVTMLDGVDADPGNEQRCKGVRLPV